MGKGNAEFDKWADERHDYGVEAFLEAPSGDIRPPLGSPTSTHSSHSPAMPRAISLLSLALAAENPLPHQPATVPPSPPGSVPSATFSSPPPSPTLAMTPPRLRPTTSVASAMPPPSPLTSYETAIRYVGSHLELENPQVQGILRASLPTPPPPPPSPPLLVRAPAPPGPSSPQRGLPGLDRTI